MFTQIKKIGIIGLGRSGLAAAQLLKDKGVDVEVNDCSDSEEIRARAKILEMQKVKIKIGKHSAQFIQDKELIVVSPGIDNSLIFLWAKEKNIPLISEIELAYWFCRTPIIAITGTNGKTTTTTLIGNLLKNTGKNFAVCGNIGIPFSQIVLENNYEILVLEVSSFQLERIDRFKPYISILLNISHDHLDRYKTFEEYKKAKYRIFENQGKGDWAIIDASLQLKTDKLPKILCLDKKDKNRQAVRLVGKILEIKKEIINKTLKEFKGLEHRLEYVGTIRGIRFINDSKATNVNSVKYALEKVHFPVILILGGKDKGGNFRLLHSIVRQKVKKVILIGEAKQKIEKELSRIVPIEAADSLGEAFNLACQAGCKGDTVLLSPGCASFDMFANFEERGKEFKKLVTACSIRKCNVWDN